MPMYEMPIIMKVLSKPEIIGALKRTANLIFDKGGLIRKIDNLGKKETPYKMLRGLRVANYFIFHFDVPPKELTYIDNGLKRDVDIIRWRIYNPTENFKFDCTLHEELLPPPYRPEVLKVMETGKKYRSKADRFKFKFNTDMNYYPF